MAIYAITAAVSGLLGVAVSSAVFFWFYRIKSPSCLHFEFTGSSNGWRWRLKHDNNFVVAYSAAAHSTRQACLESIELVQGNVPCAVVQES